LGGGGNRVSFKKTGRRLAMATGPLFKKGPGKGHNGVWKIALKRDNRLEDVYDQTTSQSFWFHTGSWGSFWLALNFTFALPRKNLIFDIPTLPREKKKKKGKAVHLFCHSRFTVFLLKFVASKRGIRCGAIDALCKPFNFGDWPKKANPCKRNRPSVLQVKQILMGGACPAGVLRQKPETKKNPRRLQRPPARIFLGLVFAGGGTNRARI